MDQISASANKQYKPDCFINRIVWFPCMNLESGSSYQSSKGQTVEKFPMIRVDSWFKYVWQIG